MKYNNLYEMQSTIDPTCSGTVRVHWDAYVPDGEALIDGNGDDRLTEMVCEAIEHWATLHLDPKREGTHIFVQVVDEGDVDLDDDNREGMADDPQ